MKLHEILDNNPNIDRFMSNCTHAKWNRDEDGLISVYGFVDLQFPHGISGGELPIRFGNIYADFRAVGLKLTSVYGLPISATETISVNRNEITSLKGLPTIKCKRLILDNNSSLTSFEGINPDFTGSIDISSTGISSLDFCPKRLTNHIDISYSKITSLIGVSEKIETVKSFYLNWYEIKEGGLGLLLIEGLDVIQNVSSTLPLYGEIINRHLIGNRDIYECQAELIDNDLEAYAQL